MRILDQFLFAHEETDSPHVTESLEQFEEMGIELGAKCTMWYCEACDLMQTQFEYETTTGDAL